MAGVLATAPAELTPINLDELLVAGGRNLYAEWVSTPDNPNFYPLRGILNCAFTLPCPGDDCTGSVIERSGVAAREAYERICPHHEDRWISSHQAEIQAAKDERERAAQQERLARLQLTTGLPPYFEGYTLESFPGDKSALAACREWLKQEPAQQGLVLLGSFGTGKTSLAAALLHEWYVKLGRYGMFIAGGELLERLRPGLVHDERLMIKMRDTPLLVVDDIGAEQPTEWTREQWFNIIQHRHNHLKPTILTSNHPSRELSNMDVPPGVETLEDRIGERAVQRLLDRAAFRVLIVKGKNLRKVGR
jgi:DNA replication protein DnaC